MRVYSASLALSGAMIAWAAGCGDSESQSQGGQVQWLKNIEGSDAAQVRLASDPQGSTLIAVLIRGQANFGAETLGSADPAQLTLAVAKYVNTPQGNASDNVWVRAFQAAFLDRRLGWAVDNNGNAYVAAQFTGTANFEGTPVTGGDLFFPGGALLKLDGTTGDLQWATDVSTLTDAVQVNDIALDLNANVLLTGTAFTRTTPQAPGQMWVARHQPDTGARVWGQQYPATGSSAGERVTMDRERSEGAIFVSGQFTGTITLSSTLSDTQGSRFVARLSGTPGTPEWARAFAANASPIALSTNSLDELAIAYDIDAVAEAPAEVVVQSFREAAGLQAPTPVWQTTLATTGPNRDITATAVAFDNDRRVVVGAEFQGTVALAEQEILSPDTRALLATRLTSLDGSVEWTRFSTGTNDVRVVDVFSDASGNVVCGGSFAPLDTSGTVNPPQEIFFIKLTR